MIEQSKLSILFTMIWNQYPIQVLYILTGSMLAEQYLFNNKFYLVKTRHQQKIS
jgi:hypothetical protein